MTEICEGTISLYSRMGLRNTVSTEINTFEYRNTINPAFTSNYSPEVGDIYRHAK